MSRIARHAVAGVAADPPLAFRAVVPMWAKASAAPWELAFIIMTIVAVTALRARRTRRSTFRVSLAVFIALQIISVGVVAIALTVWQPCCL